jgi:hypothetical protein
VFAAPAAPAHKSKVTPNSSAKVKPTIVEGDTQTKAKKNEDKKGKKKVRKKKLTVFPDLIKVSFII